ncbi:MAG: glycosyltransferase [Methylacidiphilales bacterium]|nr:glycosyltransferase [Candidatus Methylacidiphilales bacterium]
MRLLYLYPEEWTGRHAREVQALSTCAALAESGVDVTLVTAGGETELYDHLVEMAGTEKVPGLHLVALSRTLGSIQSTSIFSRNFSYWLRNERRFDLAMTTHLKAGPILTHARIPYAFEAHGIFTQTPQYAPRQRMMHKLEGQVLSAAALHVATSAPLAVALNAWFALSKDFAIVPNAGLPPLKQGVSAPDGPFVYCGSIADGNDLQGVIQAARDTKVRLKIVGGIEEEWLLAGEQIDTSGVEWHPHVPANELPEVLAGARAGLVPTNLDGPAGEFSCPMKLFDYARCGLPVITTALASLQSLEVGSWCTQIPSPSRVAWAEALRNFAHETDQAEAARAWSGEHTWAKRAELLKRAFGI